ncbi:MAG: hypothetical protein NTW19_17920 [Planctomycetota bacterium]|nr:hypothetical protein [Planctomycetota bacterium]
MTYALLWIEFVALFAALAALGARGAARKKRYPRWVYLALVSFAWAAMYGPWLFLSLWPPMARYRGMFPLGFILSIGAVYLPVEWSITWAGLQRTPDGCLRAERWGSRWPLVVTIASIAAIALTFIEISREINAWMTAMQKAAVATATSLAPPQVPEAENAATYYVKAGDLLGGTKRWPQALSRAAPAGRLFPEGVYNDPEIVSFVASHQPMLAMLRQGAGMKRCAFDRDYTRAFAEVNTDKQRFVPVNGVQIMALETGLLLQDGNAQAATNNLNAMRAIARHQLGEPDLLSLLVAGSVNWMLCRTLEEAVNSGRLMRDDLAAITLDPPLAFYRAMAPALHGEEASGVVTLCNLALWGGDAQAREGRPDKFLAAIGALPMGRELASYRRVMGWYQESIKLAPAELPACLEKVSQAVDRGEVGMMTAMLIIGPQAAISLSIQADANDTLAQVGLAMARYRAEHGQLPDSPAALVPAYLKEWPIDPFDGKPMRFVATPEAVTAYSIDKDLVDDGGVPLDIMTRKGDLVFRIKR